MPSCDQPGSDPAIMAAPIVVFDLDGTLVDTAPDLVATLNFIFAREGLPPVAYEAARNMVGGGARVDDRARAGGRRPHARRRRARSAGRGLHRPLCRRISRIAPGRSPGSRQRSTSSRQTAAASRSAPTSSNGCRVRLLDALGLSQRFVAICGADTFGVQKPNPELLRRTIARAAGRRERTPSWSGIPIIDIATARAAGVPVIAVDFGYTETPVARIGARPGDQRLCRPARGRFRPARRRQRSPARADMLTGDYPRKQLIPHFTLSPPHLGAIEGGSHMPRGSDPRLHRSRHARMVAGGDEAAVAAQVGGVRS